jgi:hypothetical protein
MFFAAAHEDVGLFLSGLIIAAPLNAIGLYFSGVAVHPLLPTALFAYGIFAAVEDKFNHSHVPSSFFRGTCTKFTIAQKSATATRTLVRRCRCLTGFSELCAYPRQEKYRDLV